MLSKDNGYMPALILTLVVLVTTGLLALTSSLTQAARDEQAILTANASRTLICPDATVFEPIDLTAYPEEQTGVSEAFAIRGSDNSLIGILYKSASRGYAGPVPVLVAIDPKQTIIRILPLDNDETPGLGKKVAGDGFVNQYMNLDAKKLYSVKPSETDREQLDAIAGATISSNAVTQAVNHAALLNQKLAAEVK